MDFLNGTTIISPVVLSRSTVLQNSPYNYTPTRSTAIICLSLFAISTALHTVQALFYRMWWLFPTVCLAGSVEVLGWSGRLWSSFSPKLLLPFEIQITSTILAPTPLVAANFIILGRIIRHLGPVYSRVSPKWYTIIFCACDAVSLTVQGVGGALASIAAGNDKDPSAGGNIMLGGIIFQMGTIAIYVLCAGEFFTRYLRNSPVRPGAGRALDGQSSSIRGYLDPQLKLMSIALVFNTTCLFIRAVYRVIELTDGWNGRIISTELYFDVLDGAMVLLAIYTLNFVHPGFFLAPSPPAFQPGQSKGDESTLA